MFFRSQELLSKSGGGKRRGKSLLSFNERPLIRSLNNKLLSENYRASVDNKVHHFS